MSKKRIHKNNLFLLVLIQLTLFAYPLVSKSLHVHEIESKQEHCCTHHKGDVSFESQEEACPICEYELVSFLQETDFSTEAFPFVYPVLTPECPKATEADPILHFSLRGPPQA